MNLNEAVHNFRNFLCASYAQWMRSSESAQDHETKQVSEMFHDWAQANWELLVERSVCSVDEFLEVYGDGSDYEEDAHSRTFFHEAIETHEIGMQPLSDSIVDRLTSKPVDLTLCEFDELVSLVEAWYESIPPFDHALLNQGGQPVLVPIAEIRFFMRRTKAN